MSHVLSSLKCAALALAASACSLLGTARPTSTPVIQPASGECSFTFYPVSQGATWQYAVAGQAPLQVTRTITAGQADGFTEQRRFSTGIARTLDWRCDDGLIATEPDLALDWTGAALSPRTWPEAGLSGVAIPDNLGPGALWNLAATSSDGLNFTLECRASAAGIVSVPAGAFDALRADCHIHQKSASTGSDSTLTMWFAQGVGMLKVAQAGSLAELTAYTIP